MEYNNILSNLLYSVDSVTAQQSIYPFYYLLIIHDPGME